MLGQRARARGRSAPRSRAGRAPGSAPRGSGSAGRACRSRPRPAWRSRSARRPRTRRTRPARPRGRAPGSGGRPARVTVGLLPLQNGGASGTFGTVTGGASVILAQDLTSTRRSTMTELVLVTGGTGYVAGWCIVELLSARLPRAHHRALRPGRSRPPCGDGGRTRRPARASPSPTSPPTTAGTPRSPGVDYVLHVASPLGVAAEGPGRTDRAGPRRRAAGAARRDRGRRAGGS